MVKKQRIVINRMGYEEMKRLRSQVEPLLQEAGRTEVAIKAVDVLRLLNAAEGQARYQVGYEIAKELFPSLDKTIDAFLRGEFKQEASE